MVPPSFPRDIQPVVLRGPSPAPFKLRLRGCHPLRRAIPDHFGFLEEAAAGPCNSTSPPCFHGGFGLPYSPFGRPYSGNPYWFLFLPLLRCFSSGGSRSVPGAPVVAHRQEVPFGNPRFNGYMRLPGAYRSLSRPSSAPKPSHPPGGVLVSGPIWGF